MILDKDAEKSNMNEIDDTEQKEKKGTNQKKNNIDLFDAELNSYYLKINQNNYLPEGKIIESKNKALSPMYNAIKKWLNKIIHVSLSYSIDVQNVFNSNVVKILNTLRERIDSSFGDTHVDIDTRVKNNEESLKELEKKVLEMNHYRHMEIKNIETLIHTELASIKSELGNLVYTYLFLQNNFSEALQGIKGLQEALGSFGEVQGKNNEIFRKHENLFNELQIKYDNRLQEVQLKNNEINESISRLRKIIINRKAPVDTETQVLAAKQSGEALQGSVLDYIYYDLENILRGKEEEIRFRQLDYLEYLKDIGPVLDVGCGRGELLELLARHGIEAVGVDSNKLMVDYCVSKGLKVTHTDGMSYIANLPDGSLGAITALHLIEHLDLNSLCNFLVQALKKIKDGGILILETPNPLGLFTLSQSFYLDFSHLRPVHPISLKLLLESMGFTVVKLMYLSPWEDALKLTPVPAENNDKVMERVKENFDKLNEIIFAPREYSLVVKK